jgi:formylglycine-generating enzyme required for sulfatase activity
VKHLIIALPLLTTALTGVFAAAATVDTAATKALAIDTSQKAPAVPRPKIYPIAAPEIEMVPVKGGKFIMGCWDERDNRCLSDERPRREVQLKGYQIGKYPVTQKQWRSVMGVNPSYHEGDDLPVEQVSWIDVQEFIKRLNAMTGKKYRLPTEAEWEYAALGGPAANGKRGSGQEAFLADIAWYDYNSDGAPHQVGAKMPNELGLYDMAGNVWEWVGDWYDGYYYRTSPLKNPKGPKYGSERVYRGGSFNSGEQHCRVSLRNRNKPGARTIYLGFRLAH